jgi:Rha family phage regulatory protein
MNSITQRSVRSRSKPLIASGTIVHLHLGKPVTDSLAISREFGSRHDNVLQKLDSLIKDGTINHLDFKAVKYADAKGEQRRMIELTERGALIAMPFIGGKKSRTGQVRLVNAFLAMRDMLAGPGGDWSDSRQEVSTSYTMMSDALQEARADAGKKTFPHHYANEAKLINWVLFGHFETVSRDSMEKCNLATMAMIETRNAILIARGLKYEERKAALPLYLLSLRTKRIRGTK